jgi:hypothetical protein
MLDTVAGSHGRIMPLWIACENVIPVPSPISRIGFPIGIPAIANAPAPSATTAPPTRVSDLIIISLSLPSLAGDEAHARARLITSPVAAQPVIRRACATPRKDSLAHYH